MKEKIIEIAHKQRRFGYRRIHLLLRRDGFQVNHKGVYRIYRESGLKVRKRGGRKRAIGERMPICEVNSPNQRWALDFVHDALADGRRLAYINSNRGIHKAVFKDGCR